MFQKLAFKGEKRFQRQKTILIRLIYALPTTLMGQNLHVALRTDTNKYFEGTYILISNQQPLENLHNSRSLCHKYSSLKITSPELSNCACAQ